MIDYNTMSSNDAVTSSTTTDVFTGRVKWFNNKAFPHNVVFDGHAELSHKKLAQKPKAELESTFNEAGEFAYYCSPHRGAGMQGKVVVQ